MRILKRELAFKDLVSQVLTFDYLGALAVSILFPLLLAPHLGLMRTGLLFGLLNVAVALWALHLFREQLPARRCAGGTKLDGVRPAGRRFRRGRATDDAGRNASLRRRDRPCRNDALSAHRRHPLARRPAAVPQQQPAVLVARRIPLPRGAGPSRSRQPAGGEARAGARRRRRAGGARNPQVPECRVGDPGRPRSGDDRTVRDARRRWWR